jgi:hypothetical protein
MNIIEQISITKSQIQNKLQFCNNQIPFDHWDFELGDDLEVGAWLLVIDRIE